MKKIILVILAICCFLPFVSSSMALFTGVIFSVLWGNPFLDKTKILSQKLLTYSIIGLGAGINLNIIFKVGSSGILYTFASITLTLILGYLFGHFLKIENSVITLISTGTAICGGSAIAAVSPVIKADHKAISISLGIVFILNATALLIFPSIGHFFNLSQNQFGIWSALAIHDTSSVVGASMAFGAEALETATTLKLTRAIWIIPLSIFFTFLEMKKGNNQRGPKKFPWFILGFIISSALVTYFPSIKPIGDFVNLASKKVLVLVLFLIGLNLTLENIKSVGIKSFYLGILLWLSVSAISLFLVISNILI